jgi:beta-phosphoglucomutase
MTSISGFIFDLDGVITETSEFHYQSWQQLADEEGLPFTREDNEQLRGVSRRVSLMRLLKGRVFPEDKLQDMMYRKNEYYKALLHNITVDDCLPGVQDFLDDAATRGLKLGIGSASRNARPVLEKLDLIARFTVIGDGNSVVNSKPAPDLFVWVAGGLGLPVAQVVVFEDAEAGIDAAKAAGCPSVGIGTANINHADIVVAGLHELTVEQVLTQLESSS